MKIFLSYSHIDQELADTIDARFGEIGLTLERDVRDLGYKESIREFMGHIRVGDYAVILLTENYLHSPNCMYELLEVIQERNYQNRIIPIISRSANIFTPEKRIDYIGYWENQKKSLEQKIRPLDLANVTDAAHDLEQYNSIALTMGSFLREIADMKNVVIEGSDITEADFVKICGYIYNHSYIPRPNKQSPPPPESANMVLVEGGIFCMGNNRGRKWEKPEHTVTVNSFYLGKYAVSQKEWREVMGTSLRDLRDKKSPSATLRGEGDNYPIYYVSWFDAVEYCNKLSEKDKREPVYIIKSDDAICDFNKSGYRLPTEAEWEYAAKGGKHKDNYAYSSGNEPGEVSWYEDNNEGLIHEVGTKKPNSLGIYDMSGNLWEWCWDWEGGIYADKAQTNPKGPASGMFRITRGGSFHSEAKRLRSTERCGGTPYVHNIFNGFRIACNANE